MTFQDKQILQKILAQDVAIGSVFNLFVRQVSPLLEKYKYSDGEVWAKNGLLEKRINKEVERLNTNLESVIRNNQKWAWNLANAKNDNLVSGFVKGLAVPEALKQGMFAQNLVALDQFMKRSVNGLSVSDRVWRTSQQAKTQLEYFLQSGIAEGKSAAKISQDVRQLLNNPDTLFRRVRDKNGNLVPSKPMKDYHPGQGVYKSSYKNAVRLSATEINLAYRSSDHERWQGLDFVVGIEVKLSGAHPATDICDYMKGRYPKDFKFTGWHPFCICFAVPILMPQEEFMNFIDSEDDVRRAIIERNSVKSLPLSANQYIDKHQQSIDGWKSSPIWVRDNFNTGKIGQGLKFDAVKENYTPVGVTAAEKLNSIENEIRMLKTHERAVVFDDNTGNVVAFKDGEKYQVAVGDMLPSLKDNVFTHNHPRGWEAAENTLGRIGNSFTIQDVMVAIKGDVKELRAVTPLFTFSMKRPINGWPDTSTIINEFKSTESEIRRYLYSWIDINENRVQYAEALHHHLIWKKLTKKLNITYTKKSIK